MGQRRIEQGRPRRGDEAERQSEKSMKIQRWWSPDSRATTAGELDKDRARPPKEKAAAGKEKVQQVVEGEENEPNPKNLL
jgi:hypothetical protein